MRAAYRYAGTGEIVGGAAVSSDARTEPRDDILGPHKHWRSRMARLATRKRKIV